MHGGHLPSIVVDGDLDGPSRRTFLGAVVVDEVVGVGVDVFVGQIAIDVDTKPEPIGRNAPVSASAGHLNRGLNTRRMQAE